MFLSMKSLPVHSIRGNTLTAQSIYRSRSLMQSYELNQADTAIAIAGQQNVSFRYSSDELEQRIDRRYTPPVIRELTQVGIETPYLPTCRLLGMEFSHPRFPGLLPRRSRRD